MPHAIREEHLDDLCAACKKPHGGQIEIIRQHHKVYELITCGNCGYELIRKVEEKTFNNKWEFI